MELLEEHRDLSLEEWNFMNLLNDRLISLFLNIMETKGHSKWVKFGDAGTKFFHANATLRHRRKLITSLKAADGTEVFNHESKANILWEA